MDKKDPICRDDDGNAKSATLMSLPELMDEAKAHGMSIRLASAEDEFELKKELVRVVFNARCEFAMSGGDIFKMSPEQRRS